MLVFLVADQVKAMRLFYKNEKWQLFHAERSGGERPKEQAMSGITLVCPACASLNRVPVLVDVWAA